MPKVLIVMCGIVAFVGVVIGGVTVANSYLASKSPDTQCAGIVHTDYTVTITNNMPSISDVQGKLCDTLTVTNADPVVREIAFGPHDSHVAYDGITAQLLQQDQSLKVTFVQTGTFIFHDHLHDSVGGQFTVSK